MEKQVFKRELGSWEMKSVLKSWECDKIKPD